MENKCLHCKQSFKTYPSRLKKSRGKYCSKICFYARAKGRKPWNTGKKCPTLSRSKKGKKNPNWKGGYDKKKGDRAYSKKNRAKIYKRQRRWNEENRDKVRKYESNWRKSNPEKRAIAWEKRRLKQKSFGGNLTKDMWKEIKDKQNSTCLGCNKKEPEIKLTIDHIIAVSRWEEWAKINKPTYSCGDRENIQALCRECNARKGTN